MALRRLVLRSHLLLLKLQVRIACFAARSMPSGTTQKSTAEENAADEGETAYSEGLEFAKIGEWDKALNALQRAANSDPKNEVYQKALSR